MASSASTPRVVARRRTQASKSKSKSKKQDYDDTRCEQCGSGDFGSELLLCDQCDRGFHLFCLRPILPSVPIGSWFCSSCSSNRKTIPRFPLVQTKIIDFFRIQRSYETDCQVEDIDNNNKKRRRTRSLGALKKKRRRLLAYSPSEDSARRLEQMASLATALTATGAEFSNELTYIPGMAPKSANCPAFEKGGMQLLSREDTEALNLCKTLMRKGECPPLMVVFDPLEGFTVEADKFIKDMTIITEYVGDVDYLRNRENDDGDSIMTLISAATCSKTLVICPDKRSNIARFINGINNHTPEGRKKQNLKCVRFNVDGEARVLLVANRDISKGERLYYDYNAYENEYPTEHFV
ncbi:putative [histone H3]-lysine(4) N-trimethyltransferase transcription regulator PHD family [Helianthus annuus]|nr:putative [histone H3]-lysine(4) N-trimethyltransferase transcription regulator PHD family [Helianthus annuus]